MNETMNETINVGTEEGAVCTPNAFAAEYLREIANGRSPECYWYGLCYNLTFAIRAAGFSNFTLGYNITQKYAPLWPEFSGDIEYPVPCDRYEIDGQRIAYGDNDLWVGEYGEARRRLAGFIADCIEKGL